MSEDINNEILKELKRSRRFNQIVWGVVGVFIILNLATSVNYRRPSATEPTYSWTAPQTAVKRLDYAKALSLVKTNITMRPYDYYGYSYLGVIYLAMGDVTNSEAAYLRAYKLFPSEENEKNLVAVRKRMSEEGVFKILSK